MDRKTYEDKFKVLKKERENIQTELNRLELSASDEKEMKDRLREFRKYFDVNKPLKKFIPVVFKAIVDHIVLGGIDDAGNKDPHLLTFIFKTGPKSKISMPKPKRGTRKKNPVEKGEEVCSLLTVDTC